MTIPKKRIIADVGLLTNDLTNPKRFSNISSSYAINSRPEADANRVKKAWEEGQYMTREDAKKNLIACGVTEPTDEQVTAYLNQVNGAVKSEKDRAEKYKAEADKTADLQKQLDEINSKGLTDVEKANKATEDALKKVAELEKNIKTMQTQKELATLGITGEVADNMFNEDGSLNFATLGQVLTEREKAAATAKEAELAGKAGNPGGSNGGGETEKSAAETYAEGYAKRMTEGGKAQGDAMASYLK